MHFLNMLLAPSFVNYRVRTDYIHDNVREPFGGRGSVGQGGPHFHLVEIVRKITKQKVKLVFFTWFF